MTECASDIQDGAARFVLRYDVKDPVEGIMLHFFYAAEADGIQCPRIIISFPVDLVQLFGGRFRPDIVRPAPCAFQEGGIVVYSD